MDLTGILIRVFNAVIEVLEWLNTWWVSPAVELTLAAYIAYRTCIAPQVDWSYIKEMPGRFFTYAFLVFSYIRLGPFLVKPQLRFSCDPHSATVTLLTNPGLARHCQFRLQGEYDSYGLADFVIDGLMNSLSALAVLAGGFVIGATVRSVRTIRR